MMIQLLSQLRRNIMHSSNSRTKKLFIVTTVVVVVCVLQQQQQQQRNHHRPFETNTFPISIEAHSGCDSSNSYSNSNVVIPFWNIAARNRHRKQLQQVLLYDQQQQQQRNLLQPPNGKNHTTAATTTIINQDGTVVEVTVDFCVDASSLSNIEHPQQQQQQQQYHPVVTSEHTQQQSRRHRNRHQHPPAVANQQYRGGATTTTTSTSTTTILTTTNDSNSTTSTTTTTRVDDGYKPLVYDTKKKPYTFSFFQHGDGSDYDIDGIPTRYMMMQNNDRDMAKTAVQHTLQWRSERDIDTILQRPNIHYDIAKQVFPHYFVQDRDTTNHILFVQRPALLNLPLANHNQLSPQQLLEHYIYVNEYLWQILEGKDALATMTSILDLQGLNFKYLRQGDMVNFMKEFVKTMDHHYPQRAYKTMIINAPKWFHVLYKIVSPLLRESTKAKIEIFTRSKRQDKALKALLGNDKAEKILPASFFTKKKNNKKHDDQKKQMMMMKNRRGMKVEEEELEVILDKDTTTDLDDENKSNTDDDLPVEEDTHVVSSKFETELREFTLARIKEAGVQMLPVVPLK